MKTLRLLVSLLLLFQFIASASQASPVLSSPESFSKAESETSPETKITPDEEYVQHSQKAEKFVFTDLPRHLGYDLKESFWGWGALGLGVGLAFTAGLHEKDHDIQSSFSPHALFGNTGDEVINQMGAPYTMAGVGVLTAVIGGATHNEKLWTTGESALESLFWTEIFTFAMKYAIDRDRPDGSKRGFPSGHASGAFSTATVFEVMYGPKVGVPLYAFASLVAIARVDSFKHFPSDVLMGAVLGSVIGYGTAHYHKKLHSFAVQPDVGPDRYGLVLQHGF
jgi:membrane-associated phospholipid phosphatase